MDLDAVLILCDAATPGPWFDLIGAVAAPAEGIDSNGMSLFVGRRMTVEDSSFIAQARTLVPQMAAEIRELRAELAAERARTDALVATLPRCDECAAPATENEFGYDGRVTYWCDDHGPFCDATPWDVALRDIAHARRLAAGGEGEST